jgi:riboflavin synthase
MFTGLIEGIGRVAAVRRARGGARLRIEAAFAGARLGLGESVSVDGACLTVVAARPRAFEADVSRETIERTTLSLWRAGRRVNLERALTPSSRIGGHFVQGHVDGTGTVLLMVEEPAQSRLRIRAPGLLLPLIAEKGSIAVDGVSLTVSARREDWFEVALIPHTLAATNLPDRRRGDPVNLEADLLARHLARLLESRDGAPDQGKPSRRGVRRGTGSVII